MSHKAQVLVTGGAGYIGSHTVVELQLAGYDVIIVDNLSNSSIEILSGIEKITNIHPVFLQIDCGNRQTMMELFEQFPNISTVIHFAAYKAVGESVQNPLKYYHNNILSLVNLLKVMQLHNIHNLIFSSSCTVYGQPTHLPVDENAPIQVALSPYGNTKRICEEIITDYAVSDEYFASVLLRYFNPIGAHPSAEIGELPLGIPQNLLPFVTQTAAGIRPILNVFGNDYNTSDGSCIRDYISVTDLAKAHLAAVEFLLKKKNLQQVDIFNIGSGKGWSVLEIIDAFQKANQIKVPYKIVGRRAGDIEQVWANPQKANTILGWKAKESMEDTLRTAWKWEQKIKLLSSKTFV
jgi:UDP-glucose 4-epimerase